ncbi:MAG: molybdate ABC transporter substrate-binding protein [Cyanobacteria bacterium P01_D01_bin.156]
MQRRKYFTLVLASIVSWLMAVGCTSGGPSSIPTTPRNNTVTITISAAASLQNALEVISPKFTKAHPNITVDYNFASSGALQRQIEQGAPSDAFFSAATQQMEALLAKELILTDSRQDPVANNLVLIAPLESPLAITDITQLKDVAVDTVAVGEFRSVPAGQYAEQVFQNLGLSDTFNSKFIFGNNVRSVLSAVESGNVELGIVYASDALLSTKVKVLATIPEEFHQPIVYPVAVVKNSPYPEATQTFIDFLATDSAQAIFTEYGFSSF